MRPAIITKYVGPTNTRGARIMARTAVKTIYVPYRHRYDAPRNHLLAAKDLAEHLGWEGNWHSGTLPNGDRVHVWEDGSGFNVGEISPL